MLSGPLSRRYGARSVLIGGSFITALTLLLVTLFHSQEWQILVEMTILGSGFGLAFAAMSNLVVEAVPPGQTGVASGMNANIRTIGGSLGAAVMSSIVTATAHHGGLPTESGYTRGFGLLTIAALGAAFAAMAVPRARRRLTAGPDETMPHAELALVAAGTLVGDESE
jgi:MFS family permease